MNRRGHLSYGLSQSSIGALSIISSASARQPASASRDFVGPSLSEERSLREREQMDRRTEQIIDDLVARLEPVRPMPSPWFRAASWLGVACIALTATVFAFGVSLQALQRISTTALWIQVGAPTLVGIAGTYAAFMLAMPDRDWRWAFVPMPLMVIWTVWAALQACPEMNALASCWNAIWSAMRLCLVDPVWLLAMLATSLALGWTLLRFNRHAWLGQRSCAACGAAAVASLSAAAAVFYRESMSLPSILVCHVGFSATAEALGFLFGDRLVRSMSPRAYLRRLSTS